MSKGAVHNAISRGLLPSALSRAIGDAEGSAGLERYGETLTPILDLWSQPEWRYLRREYLMARTRVQAAVAGELSTVALVNPAGSGTIAVVEAITVKTTAAQNFLLFRTTEATVAGTLALAAVALPRDTRAVEKNPGRCVIYDGSDPNPIGAEIERLTTIATVFQAFTVALPLVLGPGGAVAAQCQLVNTSADFCFGWRERTAFPGELE